MSTAVLDRLVLLVCDGLGCGAQPDATPYGDQGADTLSNLSVKIGGLTLPFLQNYGIGSLTTILGVPPVALPFGAFGKMRRISIGKSSELGYWELVGRRDQISLETLPPTVLETVAAQWPVIAIGPLHDVFGGRGVTEERPASNNADALEQTRVALGEIERGLIVTRLPELTRHRRDAAGYYRALQAIDAFLPRLVEKLRPRDLLVITGDQGGDPTLPGDLPTREEVPLLCIGQNARGRALGTRVGFYDVAQTICDGFALPPWPRGESLLPAVS